MAKSESFKDIINGAQPVLIDFFAEWCGPCKAMSPVIQDIASDYKEKIRVIKIDVDKNPEIATNLNIMGVPTLMLFSKGKVMWRQSGMLSRQALSAKLEQYAN